MPHLKFLIAKKVLSSLPPTALTTYNYGVVVDVHVTDAWGTVQEPTEDHVPANLADMGRSVPSAGFSKPALPRRPNRLNFVTISWSREFLLLTSSCSTRTPRGQRSTTLRGSSSSSSGGWMRTSRQHSLPTGVSFLIRPVQRRSVSKRCTTTL